jgi:hypothetical protein
VEEKLLDRRQLRGKNKKFNVLERIQYFLQKPQRMAGGLKDKFPNRAMALFSCQ